MCYHPAADSRWSLAFFLSSYAVGACRAVYITQHGKTRRSTVLPARVAMRPRRRSQRLALQQQHPASHAPASAVASPSSCADKEREEDATLASFLLHPCSFKAHVDEQTEESGSNTATTTCAMNYQCNDQLMDILLAPRREGHPMYADGAVAVQTPGMHAASQAPAYATPHSVTDVGDAHVVHFIRVFFLDFFLFFPTPHN